MNQAADIENTSMLEPVVTSRIAIMRLAIGLAQGIFLYLLYRSVIANLWPATEGYFFSPLLLAGVFVPVVIVSSLGHLDRRQIVIWALAVTGAAVALALYDAWRGGLSAVEWFGSIPNRQSHYPSPLLVVFFGAGLHIAHSLVVSGAFDKQRIARYPTYFETGWKLLIQLSFSAMFVLALWLALWLGAALFALIKLNFLVRLFANSWFVIPISAFAFSCAMHITDVRPVIVRGIRTLLLVLLSWILPVIALLIAGFLLSLPWTGLKVLWATRHATSVLLGSAAVLVILINAAFQNGEVAPNVARVIRWSSRLAAVCLLPIVTIAIYALGLRVEDYGWTNDRVIAAACLLVASCYALGYFRAACQRTGWMPAIAGVNVFVAFLTLVVLVALFTPLADPARISVNDQVARLTAGKISAEKFDFDYLRFQSARYGISALEKLKLISQGAESELIRKKAEVTLKKRNRWPRAESSVANIAANITVWPQSTRLPASFLKMDWATYQNKGRLPLCMTNENKYCDAYLIDFNSDEKPELLLVGIEQHAGATVLMEDEKGKWNIAATLPYDFAGCTSLREELQAGSFKLVPQPMKDIEIGGKHIVLKFEDQLKSCPK